MNRVVSAILSFYSWLSRLVLGLFPSRSPDHAVTPYLYGLTLDIESGCYTRDLSANAAQDTSLDSNSTHSSEQDSTLPPTPKPSRHRRRSTRRFTAFLARRSMSYSCFEMLTRSDTTSTDASSGVHRSNTKSSCRTDIVALVRKALYSVNTDDYVEDAIARLGRFSQWTLKRKSTLMSRYRRQEEEDEEDLPEHQSPVYFDSDNHYPTTGLPYSRYYCHTLYESETSLTSSISDPLLYSSQPSTRSSSTKQHVKASSVAVCFPPPPPQSSNTTALSMSTSFPPSATTRSIPATRSIASMNTPYDKHFHSMPPSSTLRSLASKRTTLGSLCEEGTDWSDVFSLDAYMQ